MARSKAFSHITGLELNYSNCLFMSLVKELLYLSMASRFAAIPKEPSRIEVHKALLRNVAGSIETLFKLPSKNALDVL